MKLLSIKRSFLLVFSLLIAFSLSATGETEKTKPSQKLLKKAGTKVAVVYFHQVRRCPTCVSIGKVSREVVEKQYKDKSVKFIELASHEKQNREIVEELKVFGSGLFVITKGKVENLTAIAFQTARLRPSILEEKLKGKVDSGLKK